MTRWLCVLALLLAPACMADEKPALPDFAPSFMRVVDMKYPGGHMHLRTYLIEQQEVRTISVDVGGGTSIKTERVYGPSRKDFYVPLKGCKFVEASGKAIKKEDVDRRLKPGAVVLLTHDSKLPSKTFLSLLKPETIIIVAPAKLDPRIKLPDEPKGPAK